MIHTNTTIEEADFDEALRLVPEEVQDFMWGDGFDYLMDTAQKILSLSDDEKSHMRRASYTLLLGLTDMEHVAKDWIAKAIDPEKITKMLFVIHNEIFSRVKIIMENADLLNNTNSESAEEPSTLISAPSPADMLARLNQTLTQPTTFASNKRALPIVATTSAEPSQLPTTHSMSPTIDPYRELPKE